MSNLRFIVLAFLLLSGATTIYGGQGQSSQYDESALKGRLLKPEEGCGGASAPLTAYTTRDIGAKPAEKGKLNFINRIKKLKSNHFFLF